MVGGALGILVESKILSPFVIGLVQAPPHLLHSNQGHSTIFLTPGSPNLHQPPAFSPPRNCNCVAIAFLSARHEQTPPQHVPERPPPEHSRRRRLLCHRQSRRGRLTPHTRSTFNITGRLFLYNLIGSRSTWSFVIMAHGLEDVDGLVGGAAHVS